MGSQFHNRGQKTCESQPGLRLGIAPDTRVTSRQRPNQSAGWARLVVATVARPSSGARHRNSASTPEGDLSHLRIRSTSYSFDVLARNHRRAIDLPALTGGLRLEARCNQVLAPVTPAMELKSTCFSNEIDSGRVPFRIARQQKRRTRISRPAPFTSAHLIFIPSCRAVMSWRHTLAPNRAYSPVPCHQAICSAPAADRDSRSQWPGCARVRSQR